MTGSWAVVLGGGGLAGIAWEIGILRALAEKGLDPRGAGLVVGTSAGATVAGQLASGLPIEDLFARQADPARQTAELTPQISPEDMTALWESLTATADAGPEERGRLPVPEWPEWRLVITAVDAGTGRLRVFDGTDGVGLVDAVTASCAVPGVWPPVTIDGARYIDGGVRTSTNADLADGFERLLILAPMADADTLLEGQVAALRERSSVEVIVPDEDTQVAFGLNPLDPAVRTPCALAGYAQGKRDADPEGFLDMTERKPPGVSFESWIDRQIRDAAERGEFDNLPGAGKPLPGAGQPDDENWWLRGYLRREGVTGETMLPAALLLRREIEELPALVRRMRSEERVREAVAELNTRILTCLREPSDLRVPLRPVNADAVVARWREDRAESAESADRADPADRATDAEGAGPEAEPADATREAAAPPRRRWWRRR